MTDQDQEREAQEQRDRREQRMMWIFSAVIILMILGGMGANMLFHHETPGSEPTDISSQSRAPN
jgi:flagellar basal body-associated protein FliL